MTSTSVVRMRNGKGKPERILCWGRTHIGGPRRGFHAPAAGIGVCWAGGGRPSGCLRSQRSVVLQGAGNVDLCGAPMAIAHVPSQCDKKEEEEEA